MTLTDIALTKADTVALWHAVNWMELCVRQSNSEGTPQEAIDAERERLQTARRALRKVNALRKAQTESDAKKCRSNASRQAEHKPTEGAPL